MGIGEMRVTMNGNSEYIVAIVKDVLRTVAMMKINIQNGNSSVTTQKVCSYGGRIKIAKTSKRPSFGVMARRSYKRISNAIVI